jgi:hypothetical protein
MFFWEDAGTHIDPNIEENCSNISPNKPLLMDQVMVVAIDISEIPKPTTRQFKILNINITNQQGTSLNPTPIRPSVAAGTASGPALGGGGGAGGFAATTKATRPMQDLKQKAYYLTWPNQLAGDVIPTVGVTLVYTPVAPGLPWTPDTFYPAGSIVVLRENALDTSDKVNGHYYIAVHSGISSETAPTASKPTDAAPIKIFPDGGITWKDMGMTIPGGTSAWTALHAYNNGDRIKPTSANGHYYTAQCNNGLAQCKSGNTEPTFPTDGKTVIDEATLTWTYVGNVPAKATLDQWAASTPWYSTGAQVVPQGIGNGHYYQVIHAGASDTKQPQFPNDGTTVAEKTGLVWQDMGLITKPQWQTGTAYAQNSTVVPNPANGYFYAATLAGVSGVNQPAFATITGTSVSEGTNLVWMDAGSTQPAATNHVKVWTPNTPYFYGDAVLDPDSGHYYTAIQAGMSGTNEPPFFVPKPAQVASADMIGQWQDIGTSLPTSVTLGTPPSDQNVNLLNYTYAQAHALSRFNLSSGVVFDFIKPPNIVNTGTAGSPIYTSQRGTPLIDPVLAVTVYFKPIDAERQFKKSDLIPGGTVGFSLSSPTSNFYLGGSSELFIRNLQAMYGVALLKVTELGPLSGTAGTGPVLSTIQQEKVRGFVGISFNITGFLQSLF